jgi:hypothetical protein
MADVAAPAVPADPVAIAAANALAGFRAELQAARDDVADFALRGRVAPHGALAELLADLRKSASRELNRQEAAFNALARPDATDARLGIRQIWRIIGRHVELLLRLDRVPFDVIVDPHAGEAGDFVIQVRDVPIPDDTAALKGDIDTVQTIVRSVMADREARLGRAWFWKAAQRQHRERAFRTALADYMRDLLGIAQTGLMTTEPSCVKFSGDDLKRLKLLFTMREAGEVKNSYVRRLFMWAAIATLVFGLAYALMRGFGGPPAPASGSWRALVYGLRNFALLGAGTAIGTWLSFSLRRQELAFEDLAVLEPDRLNPSVRVVYMVGLASLVGLLLFTGAVIAGLGSVTGFEALHQHGSWALLLGMLAGIAERTLGSAVSRRSDDFAAAVGGNAPAKVKV